MRPAVRNLCLLHLLGNALLLWCGYYWLGVGESSVGALAWSALVALVSICAALWLHGAALVQFGSEGPLKVSFKTVLRNLLPLFLLAAAGVGVYLLLDCFQERSYGSAFNIASYLTLKLRKPVKPLMVEHLIGLAFGIFRWMVLPVFLLPLAAAVGRLGWPGFRSGFWRMAKRGRYWLMTFGFLAAYRISFTLIAWVPETHGFGMEMASFLARALAAYLLLSGALLAVELLTGRWSASAGSPRSSQPTTVDSP